MIKTKGLIILAIVCAVTATIIVTIKLTRSYPQPSLPQAYTIVVEGGATMPKWSPSGGMFASYVAGDVLVYNRSGKFLARFQNTDSFSWNPRGDSIAGAEGLPPNRVFVAKPDGSDYKVITETTTNINGIEWALPNIIVLGIQQEKTAGSILGRVDAKGGDIIRLGDGEKVSSGVGGRLVFVRESKENKMKEIVVTNSDGSSPAILAKAPSEEFSGLTWGPLWSPDGKWVAYAGNDPGKPEVSWLNVIDAERPSEVRRLVQISEVPFAWSPDSTEIVITASSRPEKGPSLTAVNITNGSVRKLATPDSERCRLWQPAWSKDGLLALHDCATEQGDELGTASLRLYNIY